MQRLRTTLLIFTLLCCFDGISAIDDIDDHPPTVIEHIQRRLAIGKSNLKRDKHDAHKSGEPLPKKRVRWWDGEGEDPKPAAVPGNMLGRIALTEKESREIRFNLVQHKGLFYWRSKHWPPRVIDARYENPLPADHPCGNYKFVEEAHPKLGFFFAPDGRRATTKAMMDAVGKQFELEIQDRSETKDEYTSRRVMWKGANGLEVFPTFQDPDHTGYKLIRLENGFFVFRYKPHEFFTDPEATIPWSDKEKPLLRKNDAMMLWGAMENMHDVLSKLPPGCWTTQGDCDVPRESVEA